MATGASPAGNMTAVDLQDTASVYHIAEKTAEEAESVEMVEASSWRPARSLSPGDQV